MKKTISAAVGGCNFIFDEDAFAKLSSYLEKFKDSLDPDGFQEVMEELEMRVADLFREGLHQKEVVDASLVDSVISQLGLPTGQTYKAEDNASEESSSRPFVNVNLNIDKDRKLFRDPDEKKFGGVCSGMGYFFDIDPVLIRVIFVIAAICASAGFWIYLLLWFVIPEAKTAAQKCQMRRMPATAENIRRFTNSGNEQKKK